MIREPARAKVNLSLHVTGRREDGYRLLDSLVVFPDFGDVLSVEAAQDLSLTISGPFADALKTEADNLILRAARELSGKGARIHLEKALPVASGIGGGSADAAAALRALSALWGVPVDPARALALGADVPVCLLSRPCRMRGIGEVIDPVPGLPAFGLLLANAGAGVATGAVFNAAGEAFGAPMPDRLPDCATAAELAGWLGAQRNDLQDAACTVAPVIGDVLSALAALPGRLLVRMSGSGGTCFAMFEDGQAAQRAGEALRGDHPGWWIRAGQVDAVR